jgi:hypothetical protein
MVLRQESEDQRRRPGREGIDGVPGERNQDEGDDDGRQEQGGRQNGEEKRLEGLTPSLFPVIRPRALESAYGKLAGTPQAFNDAQMIYRHGCEQEGCGAGITCLRRWVE